MTNELLPCPFCGETPSLDKFVDWSGHAFWDVVCMNIKCSMDNVSGNGFSTKDLAIKAWNTRHDPDPLCKKCGGITVTGCIMCQEVYR